MTNAPKWLTDAQALKGKEIDTSNAQVSPSIEPVLPTKIQNFPWQKFDKNGKFRPDGVAKTVNFNGYEQAALEYFAKKQDRSMHYIIKQLLNDGLDKLIAEEEGGLTNG